MLDGFDSFGFTHEGVRRDVYTRGEGPGVVVMHEIPGITPEVARFARRVADDGFHGVRAAPLRQTGPAPLARVRARPDPTLLHQPGVPRPRRAGLESDHGLAPSALPRSASTLAADRASAPSACA